MTEMLGDKVANIVNPQWNPGVTVKNWISTQDELPENQVPVLAVGKPDTYKMRVRMVAYFIRKFTVSADYYEDEVGDSDWDEATDLYYTPEGWYEVCHGNDFNPRFSGTVTHWMPLPAQPEVQP